MTERDSEEGTTSPIPRPKMGIRPTDDDDEELPEGSVSWERFGILMGVASSVAIFSLITFLSVGMVLGATVGAGMGGFVAEFEDITYTADDAKIYPILDKHPACDNAPHLGATLGGQSTLKGNVSFYKDLPLPSNFNSNKIARIYIVATSPSGGIPVSNLELRLSEIVADKIELGNTVVREYGPNQWDAGTGNDSFAPFGNAVLDPNSSTNEERVPEYGINAELFNVSKGQAAAHQVSFDDISLEEVDLAVVIDDKSSFADPPNRVVEPNNRTCTSLFNQ